MATDKFDILGPAMAAIGGDACRSIGGKPDGIFLYVEIGDGWTQPNLFKDGGDHINYHWGSDDLGRLIEEAWYLELEDKRWTAMRHTIEGGKFAANFDFDDLEHSAEDSDDRVDRIVREHYGDKPIKYPPMPAGSMELKPPA